VAVQSANVSHIFFENLVAFENPNRTRGSGAAIFRSKFVNLGTQLPVVPLPGAKQNKIAAAPARNLHDKPLAPQTHARGSGGARLIFFDRKLTPTLQREQSSGAAEELFVVHSTSLRVHFQPHI
jgi:hypothetical protein